eukprot:CAMPEP_0182905198 /NCGR_PEP_ID=MMETSP0034_2-20130328/32751_1 /TAXON_ID=156128 /ORGANISM="Nephroselmis pyriformis, Strain CCMP717" /LENGTH=133 /DNA_ID=CAMNT_0025040555 /DNA_START=213 /DNA_END=614 /DNA_ORIENTATION=+
MLGDGLQRGTDTVGARSSALAEAMEAVGKTWRGALLHFLQLSAEPGSHGRLGGRALSREGEARGGGGDLPPKAPPAREQRCDACYARGGQRHAHDAHAAVGHVPSPAVAAFLKPDPEPQVGVVHTNVAIFHLG